jgi:hypothetical protein
VPLPPRKAPSGFTNQNVMPHLGILSRAWDELKRDDYTLVIVLSAMAIECELARLFFKWTDLEIMDKRMPTQADADTAEEQWRKWNSITVRLDKVSTLLTGENFDAFLLRNPGFLAHIQTKYPTFAVAGASARDDLKDQFFHKRNKIVHRGEIDFKQPDAELCFTLAAALFQIMKDMDENESRLWTPSTPHLISTWSIGCNRLPIRQGERPVPVGVVSKNYRLLDHHQILKTIQQSMANRQLNLENVRVVAEWTSTENELTSLSSCHLKSISQSAQSAQSEIRITLTCLKPYVTIRS